MGTHMWTNGTSRRGRRMSLELPRPDLLQGRPDLFYPFLPTFLNGLPRPPFLLSPQTPPSGKFAFPPPHFSLLSGFQQPHMENMLSHDEDSSSSAEDLTKKQEV